MNAPSHHSPAVRTTCPYCGVGCGLLAKPDGRGGAVIAGDPDHPANFGRLCSKGAALGDTLGLERRLLHPMLRQSGGGLTRVDWPTALDHVAGRLTRIIARDGPDAVAFYLSGQLLTEDYYVANKLMKGFIGSANIDTNSRLCMASSVAGHRRAFGSDTVPGNYEDLDLADLIVLVGSNAAWCHPVLYQRMTENKRRRGARIVVIEPRRTATAEDADLFLPIAPGSDTALFCGLLVHLTASGCLDIRYINDHTADFDAAFLRATSIAPDIARTAEATGLDAGQVARFFDLFARTPRVVTCFSQGVNQSAQGTDKVNSIINCHLATGRIGRPGTGPFSLTGQPNAMGGREVGGLANQLAAHMGFAPAEIDRVRRFWNAPVMAEREGLKAVQMFDAVARGDIKALWVMATNPAATLPRAGAVREALAKLELLVVSENVLSNDTVNAGAHVLLPAAAWGEKDGTVTNSERRISRQRRFLPLPGDARPDWWIVAEVARRMGFADAFPYGTAVEIFREHAALSAFENGGRRDFDLADLAEISESDFDGLLPVQWPTNGAARNERFFADGGFFTPDRRARFVAPEPPALAETTSERFPLRLNTGRIRDQWHTMTRSGLSPRLCSHLPEPFVEVHPADCEAAGLRDGGFARVTTLHGSRVLKVVASDRQRRGSIFAPIHWSAETASGVPVGALIAAHVDPFSGQPEAKATAAHIAPVEYVRCGFAIARRRLTLPQETFWSEVALPGGVGYLIATNEAPQFWQRFARTALGNTLDFAEYVDARRDLYRAAAMREDRLESCIFIGPAGAAPQWDAVKSLLSAESLQEDERRMLLSGRAAGDVPQTGPTVCTCFGVGLAAIKAAIAQHSAETVEDIGRLLRAGTNCGSCLPELKHLISQGAQGHARIADPV